MAYFALDSHNETGYLGAALRGGIFKIFDNLAAGQIPKLVCDPQPNFTAWDMSGHVGTNWVETGG